MSRSNASVPCVGIWFGSPGDDSSQPMIHRINKPRSRRARPIRGDKELRPVGRTLPDTNPRLRLDEHGASLGDLESVVEDVHVRHDPIGSILAR